MPWVCLGGGICLEFVAVLVEAILDYVKNPKRASSFIALT
jgi:hypothetical protein